MSSEATLVPVKSLADDAVGDAKAVCGAADGLCAPDAAQGALSSQLGIVRIATRAFWVFVVCSVAGLLIEEVYHLAVYHELQDRAGLLFGPFSPIYGIGGLATFALSHLMQDKPLPVACLAFAVTGGAVEFAVSFVLQNAFGILAWDYTGTLLSIDGRTNGYFMFMWGVLGVLCMRFAVPAFDRFIMPAVACIPALASGAFAVFMVANVVLTLVSFNCWFHRLDGTPPQTPVQIACASVFDDAFMADRFETMSLNPQDAKR